MPNRNYNAGNYHYGFNGKENDKSINEGAQDYGMRIYDNRLGRFFSRDPLAEFLPSKSPYSFADNSPIYRIDYEGLFDIKYAGNAKVSPEAKKIFKEIVDNLQYYLQNSPDVLNVIAKQTGYTNERILDLVSSTNKEITIMVEDRSYMQTGAAVSYNDYTNHQLSISDNLIDELKDITNIKDQTFQATLTIISAGLVLHEFTHYGDRDANAGTITSSGVEDDESCATNSDGTQGYRSEYNHRGSDTEEAMYKESVAIRKDGDWTNYSNNPKSDFKKMRQKIQLTRNTFKILKVFLPITTKGKTGTGKRSVPSF